MNELDTLASAIDHVLTLGATAPDDPAPTAVLQFLTAQANRLQAAIVLTTVAAQAADHAASAGGVTEFLTHECHYSGREAAQLVAVANRLTTALPNTLAALANGHITWTHATTVTRAERALGETHVADHERAWISNVANQAGPERLQRLVRAHADEQGIGRGPAKKSDGSDQTAHPQPVAGSTEPLPTPDLVSQQESASAEGRNDGPPNPTSRLRSIAREDGHKFVASPQANTASDATPASPTSSAPNMSDAHIFDRRCVHAGCDKDAEQHQLTYTVKVLPSFEVATTINLCLCAVHLSSVDPRVVATELSSVPRDPAGIAA